MAKKRYFSMVVCTLLSLSLVSCVGRQVLSGPRESVQTNEAQIFAQSVLNIPCVISVSAPENFPGHQKAVIENPFSSTIYYYPLRSVLQTSFENSLYKLFAPPGGKVLDAFSLEISPSESNLELTSSAAEFSLCCQIILRAPNSKIISAQTVRVFEKSSFDGRTTPDAVSRAARQVAETCRKYLENEKRLLTFQQGLPEQQNGNVTVAPTQPSEKYTVQEFPIRAYQYNSNTRQGTVTVDIGNKGFQARLWVVKNIGAICSSKNVALEAGSEVFQGSKYRVLNESIENGLLTITFEATY